MWHCLNDSWVAYNVFKGKCIQLLEMLIKELN